MRCRDLARGALILALISCADTEDAALPPGTNGPLAPGPLLAGEFSVTIAPSPLEIALVRNGATLLRFGADSLQVGEVEKHDDKYSYSPTGLYQKTGLFKPPAGFAWRGLIGAERLPTTDAEQAQLRLRFDGGHEALLGLEVRGAGSIKATLKPTTDAGRIGYFRLRPRADAAEGFYGLGEYFDDVNHRGKLRMMQIEPDSSLESSYNEVHVPVPLLIGSRGWGLFVDSRRPAVFAVATEEPDLIDAAFGTGKGSAEGLTFHLLGAARPLDVTKLYYDITGYPKLPAPWALGPWIWRNENDNQAQVESDIGLIRSLDLATSGIWIDRPYATAVNTFDFNPARFTDPEAMIAKAHASGLRVALWHTPYLDEKDPATQADFNEAKASGYYPPSQGPQLNSWGPMIDLTNPAAYRWWQKKIEKYKALGVEGYKLDFAEDVVPGLGSVRAGWSFFDGSDDQTAHNTIQLAYHRVYAETLPATGGFLLCRHAVHGDQASGPIIWPGDLDASFARHREKTTDPKSGESYTSVGGLVASMIAGLSLGPSGFPFYGSDTGGYRRAPPDKELFIRWFEQTALSSVMQVGTASNTVAWEKDKNPGFDDELLSLYRTYTRLHLRLWPYAWSHAQRIAATGHPIQRPFGLAYPELGEHPSDQYLFGEDLLVAPVVDRGATTRSVYFPQGRWFDWWTGEIVEGPGRRDVAAPLDRLPLYLREGGIIPLLRPTIDTMAPTTLPEQVDSFATTPGVLHARVFPGEGSSFELYDGARIEASRVGSPRISVRAGAQFGLGMQIELLTLGKPPRVADEAGDLPELASLDALGQAQRGWFHDGKSLHLRVAPGDHTIRVNPE